MLERVRAHVQRLLETMARGAVWLHLSPGVISAIGLSLSGLACALFYLSRGEPLPIALAGVSILLSGLCDSLDGSVARLKDEVTALGGFMDSTLDRYSDSLIFAGLIAGSLVDPLWGITALVGSLLTSYTRARAESFGVKLSGVGLLERAERLLLIAASAVLQAAFPAIGLLNYAATLTAALSHATVLQRVLSVRKALRNKG
ncbi:MAG: CDP-alcohol phosphatidyltransferase family protein [Candidatus Bathyarchaeia archaeon]